MVRFEHNRYFICKSFRGTYIPRKHGNNFAEARSSNPLDRLRNVVLSVEIFRHQIPIQTINMIIIYRRLTILLMDLG